jgi:hypothetical protein
MRAGIKACPYMMYAPLDRVGATFSPSAARRHRIFACGEEGGHPSGIRPYAIGAAYSPGTRGAFAAASALSSASFWLASRVPAVSAYPAWGRTGVRSEGVALRCSS